MEEVVAVAKRANAHDFIMKFADGYDTVIGERGLRLSGGQRQRVAVARAMLKDAPLLILDEATSALDTKAERAVQAGLDQLMVGRTTIMIAHRLSTIAGVDTIITLRDGRVDEIGGEPFGLMALAAYGHPAHIAQGVAWMRQLHLEVDDLEPPLAGEAAA